MSLVVIATGTANTASVLAAFTKLGAEPVLSSDPEVVAKASHVVLPGVGAFAAALQALRQKGLDRVIIDRVQQNRPLLGICLGLQLLCEGSAESPGVKGLGIIPEMITRLPGGESLRVPHMGWNDLSADAECRLLSSGVAYFANSFCLRSRPNGFFCAVTSYGLEFVSALERGNLLAMQCHPELSGDYGLKILQRWLVEASC